MSVAEYKSTNYYVAKMGWIENVKLTSTCSSLNGGIIAVWAGATCPQ